MPLRNMASFVIEHPEKVVEITEDIVKMGGLILDCFHQTHQYSLEEVKREFSSGLLGAESQQADYQSFLKSAETDRLKISNSKIDFISYNMNKFS